MNNVLFVPQTRKWHEHLNAKENKLYLTLDHIPCANFDSTISKPFTLISVMNKMYLHNSCKTCLSLSHTHRHMTYEDYSFLQEIPRLLFKTKACYRVSNSPTLRRTPSQMNLGHPLISCFHKTRISIIRSLKC
jgi:hypothetical protein